MSSDLTKQEQNGLASVERTRGGLAYTPRIDIRETDDELVLYADLPGVTPETLEIQFENRELTIQGHVPPRHQNITFVAGEYGIGDFYRTFTIGEAVDTAKISAELNNGVLTLHLPKTEKVKPRRIEVKQGNPSVESSFSTTSEKRGNGKNSAASGTRIGR